MQAKSFVRTISIGVTLVVSTGVTMDAPKAKEYKKPNIIFIICDDLNDSVEGFGGHPQCRTPNLDRLAKSGIRFINAQNNDPICGPSRASLLTGLYPHSTGYFGYNFNRDHWRNNPVLKESLTFLDFFRSNGYKVMGTGKVFHNTQEEWASFDEFGYKPSWGPWPWDGTSDTQYSFGQLGESANAVFHQDFADGFFPKTDMFGPLSNIPDIKPDPENGIPGYKGWRLYNEPFKYNNEDDRDLMPDELNANWATAKLMEHHDLPFLLCVGMNRPHAPLFAPDEYFEQFPLEEVQITSIKEDDLEDCAKILYGPNADASTLGFNRYSNYMKMGGKELLRKWTQAYLANVAFVDDQIGKVLKALSNSEYAENTYVIFTSDHGYHMGEKNYLFKNSVWEESCRVPFIVTGPDVPADKVCEDPVSLVDLFPSFIDLAGFSKDDVSPQKLDGYSIRPFLKNPENGKWEGPDAALTSVHSMSQLKLGEPGKPEKQHYSLRTKNYRYIRCNNGEEELYDHKNDPYEWKNLADDPDYEQIKMEMKSKMKEMVGGSFFEEN
jgi:arylsulfatase A-like enzyme